MQLPLSSDQDWQPTELTRHSQQINVSSSTTCHFDYSFTLRIIVNVSTLKILMLCRVL
uniref:Uncharacterized protein n=1 Tax=Arundo donax TaxID=35708 RepID=A0A0A9EZ00_ARUDO